MNIWYIADTHFDHDNIRRYANRPFATVEEMNEFIIAKWNSLVKRGDIVHHLGDFAFAKEERMVQLRNRLNGKIHLILGNHDYKNRIDRLARLFTSVLDLNQIKVNGQKIVLAHYPLLTWNAKHHGSFMLHGHSHYNLIVSRADFKTFGKVLDVGVDGHAFAPYHHDEILEIMKTKSATIEGFPFLTDHHNALTEEKK